MAGRRLREAIKTLLVGKGQLKADGVVVIAGLANTYADYVTTFEEYQEQRYEAGSTIFGPHTHAAYVQVMKQLATALADGKPAPAGVPCPDYTAKQVELLPGVLEDGTPLGKHFGDVVTDVAGANFTAGDVVFARFYAGCPRNDVRQEGTFSAVQRQDGADGSWATVADDGDWETRFIWERESEISTTSYATVQWHVPADVVAGSYRLVHTGDSKDLLQKKSAYTGTSSAFNVFV
jgi:neutral ceramidase